MFLPVQEPFALVWALCHAGSTQKSIKCSKNVKKEGIYYSEMVTQMIEKIGRAVFPS